MSSASAIRFSVSPPGRVYYNPLSQLLDVSTERAWMVYDGARTIAEMSYDGPLTRRYVWGPGADDLVLWYEGTGTGQRRWADLDERGSTTRISANGKGKIFTIFA